MSKFEEIRRDRIFSADDKGFNIPMPTLLLENQGIIEPKIPEKNCLNFRKVSTNPQTITQEQKPFAKLAAMELFPVVRKQKKTREIEFDGLWRGWNW